ncbi:hypothetical protein C8R44DRAFT_878229 [Mycena epipterygia]|nr:hypothetical protein C8R44DRAFT_878229 [Mycena epipterygia]
MSLSSSLRWSSLTAPACIIRSPTVKAAGKLTVLDLRIRTGLDILDALALGSQTVLTISLWDRKTSERTSVIPS